MQTILRCTIPTNDRQGKSLKILNKKMEVEIDRMTGEYEESILAH